MIDIFEYLKKFDSIIETVLVSEKGDQGVCGWKNRGEKSGDTVNLNIICDHTSS
jgi:hypothetical protein